MGLIHVAATGTVHGMTTQGKGREGIGREEEEWLRSIHDLRLGAAGLMDDGFAASNEASR